MILLKISVTIVIVTGLSIIAERVSPRVAGILSGYPAGSAITLFFIGLELGPEFAGQSALYNIAGLTAQHFFLYAYYRVSARVLGGNLLAASAAAFVAFLLVVLLLNALRLPPWAGILLTALSTLTFRRLFRAIPNTTITERVRLGPGVLLTRAAVSALIILAVTGVAHLVGPDLAGLFSAFPATVFPLVLIIHMTYGAGRAHTLIRNIPTGLVSLACYSLAVAFVYPRYGIYWGTVLAFGAATAYLLALTILYFDRSVRLMRTAATRNGHNK